MDKFYVSVALSQDGKDEDGKDTLRTGHFVAVEEADNIEAALDAGTNLMRTKLLPSGFYKISAIALNLETGDAAHTTASGTIE